MNDIMPSWRMHAKDTLYGAFHTNLDSAWKTFGSNSKYPSMLARHLFSFSVSYLLSGNDQDLTIAKETVKWLIDHAWDQQYGGWYDELDEKGNVVRDTKNMFVQVYTITGLTMYYYVTKDSLVKKYIDMSNDLIQSKAWDQQHHGFYNEMKRDWTINDSNKAFASQITPVSGYLMYLYAATREQKYLDQIEKIVNATAENMIDKKTGWVLEYFDKDWNYLTSGDESSEVNIGHNIETAWMLLKTYGFTGKKEYLNTAKTLSEKIYESGVSKDKRFWYTGVGLNNPALHTETAYWWIQAYGNMFDLYWHHFSGDNNYIKGFEKGASFWDRYFIDRKHGDTYTGVDSNGIVKDATKANRYKTSYHSMEHCLVNYLALNQWVNNEPVELHFNIQQSDAGDRLYPVLLEDSAIMISEARLNNTTHDKLQIDGQSVVLPSLKNSPITVVLNTAASQKK
ncbi:MAG: AGE family epimerase/isomerase [bacterium]